MKPFKILSIFGVLFCSFAVALVLAYYAPQPWKYWGLSIVLVYIASTLVIRALQEIKGDVPDEWIVYIVATFIPMVLIGLYAPAPYGPITFIVFLVLNGIIGYYWIIAIFINTTKEQRREWKARHPNQTHQDQK
jgi:hypothetical protein